MSLKTVLITGANRGIGFELCTLYCSSGQWRVIAACRNPDDAQDLQSLVQECDGRLSVQKLDVSNEKSVSDFKSTLEKKAPRHSD